MRDDVVLNSRDRKAVEEGDWSEVQPTGGVVDVDAFGDPRSRAKGKGKKSKQPQQLHRKASVHPSGDADDDASESSATFPPKLELESNERSQPYRPMKKQSSVPAPRQIHHRNNENSAANNDFVDIEVETSMIQINGKNQGNGGPRPSVRLSNVDKLTPILFSNEGDALEEGRPKKAGAQKVNNLPYEMPMQLPKKSPRGRLAVGAEKSEKGSKPMSPRVSEEPIYKNNNAIGVRMGGLQLVAPRGLAKAYKEYK
jgi:hypothetical protein